jgi:transcriptional regulator with XRE-family HTH domain
MRQKFVAEKAGLDPSRLNRIERGIDRPPKLEIVLQLADVLDLSPDETDEYIRAAGYDPENIENGHRDDTKIQALQADFLHGRLMPADKQQKKRSMPEPPQIGEMGAKAKLEEPIPAWRLRSDGTLTHANLLAFWIWNALIEGILYLTRIIGQNAFSVFTDGTNIERISITLSKNSFWRVKMYILILLAVLMERRLCRQILDKIMKYPVLQQLYEYAYEHPEEEPVGKDFYEYTLELKLPQEDTISSDDNEASSRRLSFLVKLTVLRDREGTITDFIASYNPNDAYTERIIAEKYQELTRCTPYEYVQFSRQRTFKDFTSPSYPFPLLHHDPYFTISYVNPAMQNMLDSLAENWQGRSANPIGMNFFQLIDTDPMRIPVDKLGEWEDATLRALQGLKHVKNLQLREHPEDEGKYNERIEYLKAHLNWFADLYNKSLRYTVRFPETTDEPFYACIVHYLPSEQSDRSKPMTIKSWVWLPDKDHPYILITFLPGDLASADMLEQLTTKEKTRLPKGRVSEH